MAVFKCKMCGGALEVSEGMTVCECAYCGTQQTLPKTDNEQNLNMFNRANHFRQQCEFDKAAEIYEKMAARSEGDAELYWSIVLCRYGIEYVDDPLTKRKIATCHRTQFKSILDDPDYHTALQNADTIQRSIYEREAAYIDSVQKGILEISNKEQPFDVFICYKETDEHGRRTQDSVLAQELYYGLTQEGFKVFFSRITLESKLGTEYEPYIFAALNSAKVMVVVGTKPEYFNAVWVRNEWSRYLMLMQQDRSRTLIPAYKDMDPYDLPDALSMFQAQDMSRLGFMQDLIRGIKKIIRKEPEKPVVQTVVQTAGGTKIENILKRGNLALEDGNWEDANRFFEQVLNENAEEPRAYIGLLCAEMRVHNETALVQVQQDFTGSNNYRKACRFGGDEVEKRLFGYRQQELYNRALDLLNHEQFEIAEKQFQTLGDFSDSKAKAEECRQRALQVRYDQALNAMNRSADERMFRDAGKLFVELKDFKDAAQKVQECEEKAESSRKENIYSNALKQMQSGNNSEPLLFQVSKKFESITGYKDSDALATQCRTRIQEIQRTRAAAEAQREKERIEQEERREKARQEETARLQAAKKRRQKRAIIIATASLVLIVASVVFVPKIKQGYNDKIQKRNYQKAVDLLNQGEFDEAKALFIELGNYKNCSEMADKCEKQSILTRFDNVHIGDVVSFGKYSWYAIDATGSQVTLISETPVAKKCYKKTYDVITWESSDLRLWLNGDFLHEFSSVERSMMVKRAINNIKYTTVKRPADSTSDYVYLLSSSELNRLNNQIASCGEWWWLRTPGNDSPYEAGVKFNGELDEKGYNINSVHGVRPVIIVRIKGE